MRAVVAMEVMHRGPCSRLCGGPTLVVTGRRSFVSILLLLSIAPGVIVIAGN